MHRRGHNVLLGSVLALAGLHVVDAFFVELPLLAAVLAVLFGLSGYLVARSARASVALAGVISLARFVLTIAFIVGGPTGALSVVEVVLVVGFAVASAVGMAAAGGVMRSRRLEVPS